MIKSEIKREHLKKYKDMPQSKIRRDAKESDNATLDLIPAIKLLHAIYIDKMTQNVKSTAI